MDQESEKPKENPGGEGAVTDETNELSQQISNNNFELENDVDYTITSLLPSQAHSRISLALIVHPVQKHTKKEILGHVLDPNVTLQSHCSIILNLIILGGWCYYLHCTDGEIETEEFMIAQSGAQLGFNCKVPFPLPHSRKTKSKQMLIESRVGGPTCCFRTQQSTIVDTGDELLTAGAQL